MALHVCTTLTLECRHVEQASALTTSIASRRLSQALEAGQLFVKCLDYRGAFKSVSIAQLPHTIQGPLTGQERSSISQTALDLLLGVLQGP